MSTVVFTAVLLAISFSAAAVAAGEPPYTNHTVGGAAGWLFDAKSNSSAVDYSAWAANQSFYLGDYLFFNAAANTTVIQTYNATTYALCSADEDDSNLTNVYDAKKVIVPLTEEGTNYFFSDEDGGLQCDSGMRFSIKVQHGQGLPPALNQPPPPPYSQPPPPPTADSAAEGTTSPQSQTFYRGTNGIGGSPPMGVVGVFVGALGLILSFV